MSLRLKENEDYQQKIAQWEQELADNLKKGPQSSVLSDFNQLICNFLSKINQLVRENLEVRNKYDIIVKEYKKIKKQLRDTLAERNEKKMVMTDAISNTSTSATSENGELTICKEEFDCKGMFQFSEDDIEKIVNILVHQYNCDWELAKSLLPAGLPAYILFMCIRYADFTNDEEKMRNLIAKYVIGCVKINTSSKKVEAIGTVIICFSNTIRLLQLLKQYSGEPIFQNNNTPEQNAQCLRHIDTSSYREVLSDLVNSTYRSLLNVMQDLVKDASLAILEYNEDESAKFFDNILTNLHKQLTSMDMDSRIILQIFKQLFYFICANALNSLLDHRIRNSPNGLQILYNLGYLEDWVAKCSIIQSDYNILDELQPLKQAAEILLAFQLDKNVLNICLMCNKISYHQIQRLLDLYKPNSSVEILSMLSFIKEEKKLGSRNSKQSSFLMDTEKFFHLVIPFSPSSIKLENIKIPDALNLPMLKRNVMEL